MDNAIERLKRHEGLRLKMYTDTVGKQTIGYGHNLTDMPISQEAAEQIFLDDLQIAVNDLMNAKPVVDSLSPERFGVLADMCFNLGISKLLGFKKMWAAIEAGNFDLAAEEMCRSKWAIQVGRRATELAHTMRTDEL